MKSFLLSTFSALIMTIALWITICLGIMLMSDTGLVARCLHHFAGSHSVMLQATAVIGMLIVGAVFIATPIIFLGGGLFLCQSMWKKFDHE